MRSTRWTALALALASAGTAAAHLGTPFSDAAGDLARAPAIAVVRAVAETRMEAEGALTEVERIATLAGETPPRLRMRQPGPHLHRLARGEVVVAPLSPLPDQPGLFLYGLQAQTPLAAADEPVEGLRAAVRAWRSLPQPTPPGVRQALAVAQAAVPSPLARRLALEQLLLEPATLGRALDPTAFEALVAAIRAERLPAAYRQGLMRVLELAGASPALVSLCRASANLSPPSVRAAAYESLASRGGPCLEAELDRCARNPTDPLRAKCLALGGRPVPAGAP